MMKKLKHIMPEGNKRARIRATTRVSRKLEDGTIGETLGDESRGMVVVDFDGHPHKYDQLEILSNFVAKEVNVLKVDVPNESGRGWKRTHSEVSTQELGDSWRDDVAKGSKHVRGDLGEGKRSTLRCEVLALRSPLWHRVCEFGSRCWKPERVCEEPRQWNPKLVPEDSAVGVLEVRLVVRRK